MINKEQEKEIASKKAIELIKNNMIVGLGTGSTVFYFIRELGEKIKKGLKVKGISTSLSTTLIANKLNIPLITIDEVDYIDILVDGVDEVDKNLNGIKGGGGALLYEKVIASISKEIIWIADSSKVVEKIGKFPLPVEVIPFALSAIFKKLEKKGLSPKIRKSGALNFITDSNNNIIDINTGLIKDPKCLELELNMIPGVVDNGLFLNNVDTLIIGKNNSFEIIENKFKARLF